jgi:hypothetical protein
MNKKSCLGLVLSAMVFAVTMLLSAGSLPAQVARAQDPEGSVFPWDADGNKATNKSFIGTSNSKPLVFKTGNTEKMRILPDGRIGIGTNNPSSKVEIAAQDGLSITGYQPFLTLRDTNAGGARAVMASGNGDFAFYPNSHIGGTPPVVIKNSSGNVGMGLADPSHTLEIRGDFQVLNPDSLYSLYAASDRTVSVGALAASTTKHLCYFGYYTLSTCSSAAEYVPSIDGGKGFPETADLVSIAPDLKNPYGDAHGPFAVQKSPKACDPDLLGYIVKPESGADGVYLNEHYLPLAIYGYFPAKVTMENGPIKRGDPITSSSKAGYGMKATDACKVIGYALEDANVEGAIQVFANFGDNSAAQVQALAQKAAGLEQENQSLKQELKAFEARLAALEGTAGKLTVAVR